MASPSGMKVPPVAAPPAPSAAETPAVNGPPQWTVPPELIPNLDELVIEDGKPVDGVFSGKQMRLLTEPLYASWAGPGPGRPFTVLANVGLFSAPAVPPLVPDVMLSLDIAWPLDHRRENLSYFTWIRDKGPEVTIEIVSNHEGGEDTRKLHDYERLRIPYYVIFDPDDLLGGGRVRVYVLQAMAFQLLPEPWWLEGVGLGLTLWEGVYEGQADTWLRWCDRQGQVILTGAERADQAQQALERLRAHMRSLGLEPPP